MATDEKDITLVTSLYKGGLFIRQFLENVTSQTAWDRCQLFIVDAVSPDNEYEVIKEYLHNPNIRYERLHKDPGIYGVWNYAIENSHTKYITNANVDDCLMPDCLEKHMNLLDSELEIDLAYCVNIETDSYGIPEVLEGSRTFPTGIFSLYNMLICNLPHNHPVWRKSLHKRFGYFDETYKSAADWDFWLRCAVLGAQFKLIEELLGCYYRNPEGISSKESNMERNLNEVKSVRDKFIKILSYLKQR
jgi:glycosyltransferase involved in cell wall biosynthesis